MNMESLPKYYTRLFNAVTDAIEALQNQNYGKARELLIQGQQDAEELYLEEEEETEDAGEEIET